MVINEFWSEFLALLKHQSSNEPCNFSWEELVSDNVRDIIETQENEMSAELFEQLGIFGVNFKDYSEKPTDMKYLDSKQNGEFGSISVQGRHYRFTFPVRRVSRCWQITSGKCEITKI